jgi:threonyl-tRNA synthetase
MRDVGDDIDRPMRGELTDELLRIRHSSAHIMAQAVEELFDGTRVGFGIGPATSTGFYYDFELPRPLTDENLPTLEARMREIIAADSPFVEREITPDEAEMIFADQPLKMELIDGILKQGLDDNGEPLGHGEQPRLTVYQHASFTDLCRGPHVPSTGSINPDAIRLLSVAGAYWRGDEHRSMLQRVYGTAWKTKEELDHFLWLQEEAIKRDHRKLGRELELFHLDPSAPGMPYWLPNGLKLVNNLLAFWREEHDARGYQEISAPLVNDKSLWETSGHWAHYRDNMFVIPVSEHVTYGLKPMNCPNAMVIYNLKSRSYRDLPLRLSDCDVLHRHERSGTLHGLLRVQMFSQDDAHIFLQEDQIEAEYRAIFDICDRFYHLFGLEYRLRLGTRPPDSVGDDESWERAEATLRRILTERVGDGNYIVEEGGGAFYGPKIDIMMYDALDRGWQMGTIQLDFQLPRRFNCTYADAQDNRVHPVVVHRVIYGSFERFIGILIEHTEGAFPLWLSPVQVDVIPVRPEHAEYGGQVVEELRKVGGRSRTMADDSLKARIRRAQHDRTPLMLVIGGKEMETRTVSLRVRGVGDVGTVPLDEFVNRFAQEVGAKSLALDGFVGAGALVEA